MEINKNLISRFKRIIVKLGSSIIVKSQGKVNTNVLENLTSEIARLHKTKEIIMVSSGAIGLGKISLKIMHPKDMIEKQVLAAVGQPRLMHIYENLFSKYKVNVGQMLVTKYDLDDQRRFDRFRLALLRLLDHKIIPIINENDSVAVEEIKFGDNDILSSEIASKLHADLLIILTTVDGMYKDPNNPDLGIIKHAKRFEDFKNVTISNQKSTFGTGGFHSKKRVVNRMLVGNIPTVIANGNEPKIITKMLSKKYGSWFFNGSLD